MSKLFAAAQQMDRLAIRLKVRMQLVTFFAAAATVGMVMFNTPAAAVESCRLAVLGDSLTAGYGVPEGEAFPDQLQHALSERGVDCQVINAGVSGDTSAGGRARLDWVLADKPTHLLVELGANDALRALPVDQLRDNLDAIVGTAQGQGISVMLAGMLAPPNLGNQYGRDFAAIYREVAERHGIPLYPFFLEGVAANRELLIEDAMHPNVRGIATITRSIIPSVVDWIHLGIE